MFNLENKKNAISPNIYVYYNQIVLNFDIRK